MASELETLRSLDTAEAFLEHFAIPYDQRVVDVNRLHILQRLHDRLAETDLESLDDTRLHAAFGAFLAGAYRDFVDSDARTERVFKVFHQAPHPAAPAGQATVPLADIFGAPPARDPRA